MTSEDSPVKEDSLSLARQYKRNIMEMYSRDRTRSDSGQGSDDQCNIDHDVLNVNIKGPHDSEHIRRIIGVPTPEEEIPSEIAKPEDVVVNNNNLELEQNMYNKVVPMEIDTTVIMQSKIELNENIQEIKGTESPNDKVHSSQSADTSGNSSPQRDDMDDIQKKIHSFHTENIQILKSRNKKPPKEKRKKVNLNFDLNMVDDQISIQLRTEDDASPELGGEPDDVAPENIPLPPVESIPLPAPESIPLPAEPAPRAPSPATIPLPEEPMRPARAPSVPLAPLAPLAPVVSLAPLAPVVSLAPVSPLAPVDLLAPVAPLVPLAPIAPVAPPAVLAEREPAEAVFSTRFGSSGLFSGADELRSVREILARVEAHGAGVGGVVAGAGALPAGSLRATPSLSATPALSALPATTALSTTPALSALSATPALSALSASPALSALSATPTRRAPADPRLQPPPRDKPKPVRRKVRKKTIPHVTY